jgi:hypothetical protein
MSASWIVLYGVQWVAIIVLSVLVLGLNRRLTMVGSVSAPTTTFDFFNLLEEKPSVGTRLPHEAELLSPAADRGRTAILFLSAGCGPCRDLSDSLAAAAADPLARDELESVELVVVTEPVGVELFGHIGRVVFDSKGELKRALGVKGTPVGFGVDRDGTLLAKALVHEAKDVTELVVTGAKPVPAMV